MSILSPTKKEFLKTLGVTPRKKAFIGGNSKSEKLDIAATEAFKVYRDQEKLVLDKITKLRKYDDTASEVGTLEGRVSTALAHTQTAANKGAVAVKAAVEQAVTMLPTEQEVQTKIDHAESRKVDAENATRRYNTLERAVNDKIVKLRKYTDATLEADTLQNRVTTAQNHHGASVGKGAGAVKKAMEEAVGMLPAEQDVQNRLDQAEQRKLFRAELESVEATMTQMRVKERKLTGLNRPGYKFDAPVTALLSQAQTKISTANANQAAGTDLSKAAELLGSADTEYTKQLNLATTSQEQDLGVERFKPVYEDKLLRVNEAIAKLSPLPGTGTAVAGLKALINEATPLATAKEYEKAHKKLSGLTKLLAAGENAAATFSETANGTAAAKPLKAAQQALEGFKAVAGLGQAGVVTDAENRINTILHTLDQDRPHSSVVEGCADSANKLTLELQKKTQAQQTLKEQAEQAYETANTRFGELKMHAPLSVWEPCREELRAASALLGIQHYAEAISDLGTLAGNMLAAHTTAEDNFKKWGEKLNAYATHAELITKAKKESVADIQTLANAIDQVFKNHTAYMVQSHDYALGCTETQAALDKIPELQTRVNKFNLIRDSVTTGREAIAAKCEEVQKAFKAYPKCDLSDFQTRYSEVDARWGQEVGKIPASTQAVDGIKDSVITDLDQIIIDFNKKMLEPGEKERRVKKASEKPIKTPDAVQTSLNKLAEEDPAAIELMQEKLKQLATPENRLAAEKKKRLELIKADGAMTGTRLSDEEILRLTDEELGNLSAGRLANLTGTVTEEAEKVIAADMMKIKEDADRTLEENQKKVLKIQQDAAKLATELENQIKALEKTNKDYKEYFAELRDRLSDCKGLYDCSVLVIAEKGKAQLEQVQLEIAAVVRDNAKGSGSANTFAKVETKIKELKGKIDKNDDLKNCTPSKKAVLETRLKTEITDETKKTTPAKALSETLAKFETEVNDAITAAGTAQTKRDKLKTDGKNLKKELEDPAFADVPKLKASLKNRVDAAMAPTEGREPKCEYDMQILTDLIKDAKTNVEARTQLETKANEDDYKNQVAEKQWEAKKDVFKSNAERKAKEAYDATPEKDRNKSLYLSIGEAEKEAKKFAEMGNYSMAVQKLDAAIELANQFVANPLGGQASVRSTLLKVDTEWQQAVSDYVSSIIELGTAMEKENASGATTDLTKVQAELKRIKKLFDGRIFTPFVGTLMEEAAEVAVKRTAKERALRFVREYKKILNGDVVLQYLGKRNPFVPSFSTSNVSAKLDQLELNLLRA